MKVEGYHIPSHYEAIIEDKVGTDLVGKFFKNTSSKTNPVIMVDVYHRDMQKGPTVSISSYDNPASNPKLHELTLAESQARAARPLASHLHQQAVHGLTL